MNVSADGRWASWYEWAGQPVYVLAELVNGQWVTRGTYLSDPVSSMSSEQEKRLS